MMYYDHFLSDLVANGITGGLLLVCLNWGLVDISLSSVWGSHQSFGENSLVSKAALCTLNNDTFCQVLSGLILFASLFLFV